MAYQDRVKKLIMHNCSCVEMKKSCNLFFDVLILTGYVLKRPQKSPLCPCVIVFFRTV